LSYNNSECIRYQDKFFLLSTDAIMHMANFSIAFAWNQNAISHTTESDFQHAYLCDFLDCITEEVNGMEMT